MPEIRTSLAAGGELSFQFPDKRRRDLEGTRARGFGLTLARAHGLEGRLVAEGVLARLDDEGKTGVDVVGRLLDLLLSSGGHCEGRE